MRTTWESEIDPYAPQKGYVDEDAQDEMFAEGFFGDDAYVEEARAWHYEDNPLPVRPYHGIRAFRLPTSFVAYSLVTTGAHDAGGDIAEIGAVRFEDGRRRGALATPVSADVPIDAPSGGGIADAAGAPTPAMACRSLAGFCGGLPLIGYGNHGDADPMPMGAVPGGRGVTGKSLDLAELAERLHPGIGGFADMCGYYGVADRMPHRALPVAEAIAGCYLRLIDEVRRTSTDVRDIDADVVGDELAGENVAVTGESDALSQHDALALAKAHGANIQNAVLKKKDRTTLVVWLCPDVTAKVRAAREIGAAVVRTDEFLDLVNERG